MNLNVRADVVVLSAVDDALNDRTDVILLLYEDLDPSVNPANVRRRRGSGERLSQNRNPIDHCERRCDHVNAAGAGCA